MKINKVACWISDSTWPRKELLLELILTMMLLAFAGKCICRPVLFSEIANVQLFTK